MSSGERQDDASGDGAERDPLLQTVAGIWRECLCLESLAPTDDFVAIGGDSLSAMRVAARLRATFACDLSVRDLLEARRLDRLVTVIRSRLTPAAAGVTTPRLEETPAGRVDAEPVISFAQERLWMAEHLSLGAPAYNVPAAIRVHGPFNRIAFEQSVREIQRRHAVLRTRIGLEGRRLRATCDERIDGAAARHVDVAALPPSLADERLELCRRSSVEARFDLAQDLPIRITLVTSSTACHLVIVLHHIVADAWSIGLWRDELVALYAAFAAGEPSPLPVLTRQYSDYAQAQRARLTGRVQRDLASFWAETLSGLPESAVLPLDSVRPALNEGRGARTTLRIHAPTAALLRAASRSEGVTLFALLLAAYKALLYACSGQLDVAVGTPMSNRPDVDAERLIGLFVNQVIVRTRLDPALRFRELLARVREALLSAHAHGDLPYEDAIAGLPRRERAQPPIVQTIFAYRGATWQDVRLEGVRLAFIDVHNGAAKYDLEVQASDATDGSLDIYFEYNVALFRTETIARLMACYEAILEGVSVDLDQPLATAKRAWQYADTDGRDVVRPGGGTAALS